MKLKINILFFICLIQLANAKNDKYRLVLTSNPATSITIVWNQISGTDPIVYYDTTDFGTDHTKYRNTKTVDRTTIFRGMNNKFARLKNLKPNTNYYFIIRDSQGNSKRFWFRTAPDDLSRLSFIAGGDSRNYRTPRKNANLLVSKLKPHAVFFGGDMIDYDTDREWKNWLDDWQLTTSKDGRMIPIVPARGNHEALYTIHRLFDTPKKSYYALTFGNNLIRAYTLNSEISVSGNQLTWLKNDLEATANNVIFKMAQYHKPMRPHTAGKSEGNSEYNAWANLFYKHRVRLVVDCDSHMVKTTWPIQPSSIPENDEGFIRNDENGTVYAGEGSWGAPLRANNDDKSWTRNSGSFNQFKLIFVSKEKIEMRTIKVDNAKSVEEVSNSNPFTLPKNLDIWSPTEGSVVTITPVKTGTNPKIEFAEGKVMNKLKGTNIALNINILNDAPNITKVDFYVNNKLVNTSNSSPYKFTHSYPNGVNNIKAIATNRSSNTAEATFFLNVGDFEVHKKKLKISNGNNDVEETQTGVIYFVSSDLELGYDRYKFVKGTPNGFQKIGLRFEGLNIPKGAKITNAYIQFRADEVNNAPASFKIFIENTENSLPFENNSTNNISSRTKLDTNISWNPPAWTKKREKEVAQQTPELKTLLQQIVNKKNWTQGNSTTFIIEPTGVSLTNKKAKRVADSQEGSSSSPPTLVYSYSFNVNTLNTKNFSRDITINIFPNPYRNSFSLNIPKLPTKENLMLEIHDIRGTMLYRKEVNSGKNIEINPTIKASGVYFLKIYSIINTNAILVKKIIKL